MLQQKIVVFSGSGMSAESGIATFRDNGGLWEQYKIEEVATPQAWNTDPVKVQQFYNLRRKQILETEPNSAHFGIVELEKLGKTVVITQNIDDLHERAGSKHVLHLHGNIRYAKSSGPSQEKKYYPIEGWELKLDQHCEDGYPLRPHVVWFGEEVPAYFEAEQIIAQADIVIVIGTSLQVFPAAGLIHSTKRGAKCFIIDPEANSMSVPSFFKKINMPASEGVAQLLRELDTSK
jgi:NAD-dependent deacetylase